MKTKNLLTYTLLTLGSFGSCNKKEISKYETSDAIKLSTPCKYYVDKGKDGTLDFVHVRKLIMLEAPHDIEIFDNDNLRDKKIGFLKEAQNDYFATSHRYSFTFCADRAPLLSFSSWYITNFSPKCGEFYYTALSRSQRWAGRLQRKFEKMQKEYEKHALELAKQ